MRPKLAISLNAPNDEIRSEIMPINRKWPIEAVMDAVRQVQLRPRERITFEYVLLGGVTDRPGARRRGGAAGAADRIAGQGEPDCLESRPGHRLHDAAAGGGGELSRQRWPAEGIPAYLRRPRGRDIYAACGQLKRTVEG